MRKTKLTKNEVNHIAKLANLTLSEDEIDKITKDLSDTLEFIERIKKIKTRGIKPTSHVTGAENVFREDEINSSLSQEEALSGASGKYQGYFKVSAILEE